MNAAASCSYEVDGLLNSNDDDFGKGNNIEGAAAPKRTEKPETNDIIV